MKKRILVLLLILNTSLAMPDAGYALRPVSAIKSLDSEIVLALTVKGIVEKIWPEVTFSVRKIRIGTKSLTIMKSLYFVAVDDIIFIGEDEWEMRKKDLAPYLDNIIICDLKLIERIRYFGSFAEKETLGGALLEFAFGNHTLLSMLMLIANRELVNNCVAVDAGSGVDAVLSVLLSRLKAKKVYAIEQSHKKTEQSKLFLDRNGVKNVTVVETPIEDIGDFFENIRVDIVVANLPPGSYPFDLNGKRYSHYHYFLIHKLDPSWYFMCGLIKGKVDEIDGFKRSFENKSSQVIFSAQLNNSAAFLFKNNRILSYKTSSSGLVKSIDEVKSGQLVHIMRINNITGETMLTGKMLVAGVSNESQSVLLESLPYASARKVYTYFGSDAPALIKDEITILEETLFFDDCEGLQKKLAKYDHFKSSSAGGLKTPSSGQTALISSNAIIARHISCAA
jgi:hypothetical protein